MKTARARIKYAIARIGKYGWCRGYMRKGPSDVKAAVAPGCLLGSMLTTKEAITYGPYTAMGLPGVPEAVKALGFDDTDIVITWNDKKRRRKPDVLKRLNAGLEKLNHAK